MKQKPKKVYEISFADTMQMLRSQADQLKMVHSLSRLPAPLKRQVLDHIKQTELLERRIGKYKARFKHIN